MSDETTTPQPTPSAALRRLDRLVGEWTLSGGVEGTVRYEWMDGEFFLLQHVDLEQDGQKITGMEVIGNLRPFGEEPSADVHSRFYDSTGNSLDYVYEIEDDTLTIWSGGRGSPAYFRGTFSEDDQTMTGAWVYPGGGGYDSRMTRTAT
jgi:hypothetical protein